MDHNLITDFNQGVEAAAKFMERRAEELGSNNITASTFRMIYLEEAKEIRKLKLKVEK